MLQALLIKFNSVTSIAPKSSEIRAQNPNRNQLNVESQSLSRQMGVESSRNQRGGGGAESKRKVFSIFLNKVTVLAVRKLSDSEFQGERAATAKALDPHFVR